MATTAAKEQLQPLHTYPSFRSLVSFKFRFIGHRALQPIQTASRLTSPSVIIINWGQLIQLSDHRQLTVVLHLGSWARAYYHCYDVVCGAGAMRSHGSVNHKDPEP